MTLKLKVGIVIAENDRILLIRERSRPGDPYKWHIVRGTMEKGESVTATALRECREETGLEVQLTDLLGCYAYQSGAGTRIQFTFLASISGGAPQVPPQDQQLLCGDDICEVRWFTKDEAAALSQEELLSRQAYLALQAYLAGTRYPLSLLHEC
jgi:ADP-ribose pyrophosphatase YjhB (NUDIX family)